MCALFSFFLCLSNCSMFLTARDLRIGATRFLRSLVTVRVCDLRVGATRFLGFLVTSRVPFCIVAFVDLVPFVPFPYLHVIKFLHCALTVR